VTICRSFASSVLDSSKFLFCLGMIDQSICLYEACLIGCSAFSTGASQHELGLRSDRYRNHGMIGQSASSYACLPYSHALCAMAILTMLSKKACCELSIY